MGASDPRLADITTTGHSLGGLVAGLVGGVYGRDGILFDNMPFELATADTYSAASAQSAPLLRPTIKTDIYGAGRTWAPYLTGLKTIFTNNEIVRVGRPSAVRRFLI